MTLSHADALTVRVNGARDAVGNFQVHLGYGVLLRSDVRNVNSTDALYDRLDTYLDRHLHH